MASGQVARALPPRPADELGYRIQQYEKIVQFYDAIVAGTHPTIKLPVADAASLASLPAPSNGAIAEQQTYGSSVPARVVAASDVADLASAAQLSGSHRNEINPVLLEKSDELIRAEFQLKRQRLERALKDEIEQRRSQKHLRGEHSADIDPADVLAKAMTLVQSNSAPLPSDENLIANAETASDSFDDNTFYSSQHDTLDSQPSQAHDTSTEDQATAVSSQAHLASVAQTQGHNQGLAAVSDKNAPDQRKAYGSFRELAANAAGATSHTALVPGLNNYNGNVTASNETPKDTRREQGQVEDSRDADFEPSRTHVAVNPDYFQDDIYGDSRAPSPLIRGHSLQPVAPQPAQVSSLAVARPTRGGDSDVIVSAGPPAQVTALRSEPAAISSPESSSHTGKGSDRKKGKKKKRKAGRQAPEVDEMPYIKPEPRSASPTMNQPYIRPAKRQRQSHRNGDEAAYDMPRYDPSFTSGVQEQHAARSFEGRPAPYVYESPYQYGPRSASVVTVPYPRPDREYVDSRQLSGEGYYHQHMPPAIPSMQYVSGAHHAGRSASQFVVDRPYMERYFHQPYDTPRLSVRPEVDYVQAPPRPPTTRIVVDASGREYIEPPRPPTGHSAAPLAQPPEPEAAWEGPPARNFQRHPGMVPYEEGRSMVYGTPSSPHTMPRRIVTQPEYMSQDHRDIRHREYSSRPIAQAGDYSHAMAAPERRHFEAGYLARAASVRPVEAAPYYSSRRSVQPDALGRTYAASVQPDHGGDVGQPYMREYGGRPVPQQLIQSEYGAQPPVERYYVPQGQAADTLTYPDHPVGGSNEVVYGEEGRRDMYH